MRFVFRHLVIFFSIILIILCCKSVSAFTLNSPEDLIELLLRNGGSINEDEMGYTGMRNLDKYGNGYGLSYSGNGNYDIRCTIINIPDTDVLFQLRNYINSIVIVFNNPMDITFLENLSQLQSLTIINQTIENFEPLGKLLSLKYLRINNTDTINIDCSIFTNLSSLETLIFSTDRIVNLEAIFDKYHDDIKLPKLYYISIGDYAYNKNAYGYFMINIEGLTSYNKTYREKYGNGINENYVDQFENRYIGEFGEKNKISVEIINVPDIDVLLQLKNNITKFSISKNASIADISFLKDFTGLNELRITNPSVSILESMRDLTNINSINIILSNPDSNVKESLEHLSSLDFLSIDLTISREFLLENDYTGILDFLHLFKNLDKINQLLLINEDIESKDEMYVLAHEIFKISSIPEIRIGENWFHRDNKKSYEFKLGTHLILQYRANVRNEPNRRGEVIAVLNLHDEVEILENTFIEEKINDVWGFWYKIKFDNIVGYTFGGNIALRFLVTDIDKNGVNDYFYWRYTRDGYRYIINPLTDVIIYINNKRINVDVLIETTRHFADSPYESCRFEEGDDDVLIGLSQYGRHDYEYMNIFKVTGAGKIEYISNWDEIDYW